jgi:hypothetical protein
MKLTKKIWAKMTNIFAPEIAVGKDAPPPMNRKQRRVRNAIIRKQANKKLAKRGRK